MNGIGSHLVSGGLVVLVCVPSRPIEVCIREVASNQILGRPWEKNPLIKEKLFSTFPPEQLLSLSLGPLKSP